MRQPPQIEDGQDLADLRAAPRVGRQERGAEALAHAAVIDPGRRHRHHPGTGHDLPRAGQTVAHHETVAGRVEDLGVGLEVGPSLGLEGQREHLPGGQAAQLVKVESLLVRRSGAVDVVDYPEHGVFLLAGVTRRFEIDYSGGYAASLPAVLIHNILCAP